MLTRPFLAVLAVLAPGIVLGFTCMNEEGKAVDWWAAVKHSGGTGYVYADANDEQFTSSSHTVQSNSGALYHTLKDAFKHNYALYNDETPDGHQSSSCGHTKGVVALDDALGGFWLVHSVPKFPSQSDGVYQPYPDSGVTYGQSFLCVSIKGNSFEVVADAMKRNRPQFYNVSMSSKVESQLPTLFDVTVQGTYDKTASSGVTPMYSALSNKLFTVFSKTGAWSDELYNSLISPHFAADTYCETWMNGVNPLPNFCKPDYQYNTLNIQSYTMAGYTMTNTKDHSKMAIVKNGKHVCIGGINRMKSQEARGGGSVCFESTSLNSQLSEDITVWGADSPRGGCQA